MRVSRGVLLLLSLLTLSAQEAKFSTDVNVVTLLATVRDREGGFVKDLDRNDFVLLEDGVPQTIRYFSQESGLPLTIGLLVDTSRSQTGVLERERSASYTFLDQVLRDSDRAFIAHFDVNVEVLQGFTSSRPDLDAALAQLRIPGQIATRLYTAVRDCSENLMRQRRGRKAYILLSDGVAFRDQISIVTAIEYAQRADTIIYSILFADHAPLYRPGKRAIETMVASHGRKAMQRLAEETGGAFFQVTGDQPIEKIYTQIEDALRNQYSIGYTPQRTDANGSYRKIKLTAVRPGLMVRTRDGYYPK